MLEFDESRSRCIMKESALRKTVRDSNLACKDLFAMMGKVYKQMDTHQLDRVQQMKALADNSIEDWIIWWCIKQISSPTHTHSQEQYR